MDQGSALQALVPNPFHPAFLVSAAALAFVLATYAGYPLALWLCARLRPLREAQPPPTETFPTMTCVVAAHDEGDALVRKVQNLLDLDYPAPLDIVIADDGSTDGAPARARALAPDRVRIASNPTQMGKPSALVRAVGAATGDLLLMCDARQVFERGAARALARRFRDETVGAVSGQLRLDGAQGPGFYWRYETAIRMSEGRSGNVTGVTGAIYAIRRTLFPKNLPPEIILDDVYVPMSVAAAGRRVAYAEDAIAFDRELDVGREFTRKVRTLAGNYQLMALMPSLLTPAHPAFSRFFWHKAARLLCPWALLAAVASACCAPGALGTALFAGQIGFYAIAGSGYLAGKRGGRLAALAHTFVALNVAAVWALWVFLRREARVTWVQTSTLVTGSRLAPEAKLAR
jgi:cellulose synthase/poly-beta-1,6-N-acetylglucosamine synthase-like glycosyltransferase